MEKLGIPRSQVGVNTYPFPAEDWWRNPEMAARIVAEWEKLELYIGQEGGSPTWMLPFAWRARDRAGDAFRRGAPALTALKHHRVHFLIQSSQDGPRENAGSISGKVGADLRRTNVCLSWADCLLVICIRSQD